MQADAALTRCPVCQTVFAVGSDDLARAGGRVRCGDCLSVFDARANALPAGAIDTDAASAAESGDDEAAHTATGTSLNWTLLEPVPAIDAASAVTTPASGETATPADDAGTGTTFGQAVDTDAAAAQPAATCDEAEADAAYDPAPASSGDASPPAADDVAEPDHAFRFGDDTPPDMLQAELDALTRGDAGTPQASPSASAAIDIDLTASVPDVGDADAVDDDWDDLLAELDNGEPLSLTLIDDDSGEAPRLDFQFVEQDTAPGSTSVDLDLSRADDALSAPESIEFVTLDTDIDYRATPSELASDHTSTADAPTADALVADASTPDVPTADASTPDVPTPDTLAADTATADVPKPNALSADTSTPNVPTPDAPSADASTPDVSSAATSAEDAPAHDNAAEDRESADSPVDDVTTATPTPADSAAHRSADTPGADGADFDPAALSDILSAREALVLADSSNNDAHGDTDAPVDAAFGAPNDHDAPGETAQVEIPRNGAAATPPADAGNGQSDADGTTPEGTIVGNGDERAAASDDEAEANNDDESAAASDDEAEANNDDEHAAASDDEAEAATGDEAATLARLHAAMADGGGEVIVLSGDDAFPEDDEFAASMILTAPPRPARRRLWLGLSAAALVALGIQAVHGFRGTIATMEPWGDYLSGAYALLGQPIVPRWDATQMCVERSGGALASDNVLDIETVFSNHGDRTMPMPMLKLRITDAYSDTLAGILIAPDDYLPDTDPRRELRPGEQATAIATLDYAEPRLDGFEVSLCYPAKDGRMRCALRCKDERARR